MKRADYDICLNRKAKSQNNKRFWHPTGSYPQAKEKIENENQS